MYLYLKFSTNRTNYVCQTLPYKVIKVIYLLLSKCNLAENTFQEAHRVNPNSLSIITNLASIYRHLENYSQSIK